MSTDRLLTVNDLCERWRCERDTVYAAIHAGELKAAWIGGWKVEETEANRFYQSRLHQVPVRRKPGPKPKQKTRHLTKGV